MLSSDISKMSDDSRSTSNFKKKYIIKISLVLIINSLNGQIELNQ